MEHLTSDEIIDFVSMTDLDEKSLKNASLVTGHITECKDCLRKVRAFQVIFDEFVKLGLSAEPKQNLYRMLESDIKERDDGLEKLTVENNK